MRAALAGLTTRGRSFLAAGVAASLSGLVLGERDLLRVGILLLALPLVAAVVISRARYRLVCSRRIDPPRVPVGEPARVVLRIDNLSRLRSSVLLAEDRLPYSLGGRPRFVIGKIEPSGVREIRYPVRAETRGRYTVGPLTLRFTDVFGLVETTRSFRSTSTIVVTPRVHELPSLRSGIGRSGSNDGEARLLATSGEDDVTPREYRYGDDLRRVHWRLTARHGELMVRREEQPWHRHAIVVLDRRNKRHRGDGPASSFEWAVSATASIGVRLLRDGYRLQLTDSAGTLLAPHHASSSAEMELLDALAAVTLGDDDPLRDVVTRSRQDGGFGLVVAVLGELTRADVDALATLRRRAPSCLAIVLDVRTWSPLAPAGTAALPAAQAASLLQASGWQATVADAHHGVAAAWRGLRLGGDRWRPTVEAGRP